MVRVNDDAGVRTIALNRPDTLNAFNGQQFDDLTDALLAARDDSGCRVIVLTGTGRAFSAGADLSEMAAAGPPPRHGFAGMLDVVFDFPKPFVVAVNGLGVGVGATIVGIADFAFMAESARLRCPFSELGLVAEAASTHTFPALMGRQQAMWFLMAAEWMDAAACKAAGLVLDVFPDDAFAAAVHAKAAHLAALPTESLGHMKRLIAEPGRERLRKAAAAENITLAELIGGPANREALAAFREKRKPDFSNL